MEFIFENAFVIIPILLYSRIIYNRHRLCVKYTFIYGFLVSGDSSECERIYLIEIHFEKNLERKGLYHQIGLVLFDNQIIYVQFYVLKII